MSDKPQIICLTPVKNEAWILDRFLQCASIWADRIIIADQGSTDGSAEIAKKYPKVRLIHNEANQFQGTGMRRLLLQESRKIPGKKLLIALDADEVIAYNLFDSAEWTAALSAEPGTRLLMRIANLYPDANHFYSDDAWYYIGFMDDGISDIEGSVLHEPRLPYLPDNPSVSMEQARFMHYNYLSKSRNASKLRWYMCFERIHNKRKSLDILGQYFAHHHPQYLCWKQKKYHLPTIAIDGYVKQKIDMVTISEQPHYWWDEAILGYFREYGTKRFRDLDIWDADWNKIAAALQDKRTNNIDDPRRLMDRIALRIFIAVNNHPHNPIFNVAYRLLNYLKY